VLEKSEGADVRSITERRPNNMNMTRRAFFIHPGRPIGEKLENVGEWLHQKSARGEVTLSENGGTETRKEQMLATVAPNIGLRNARANIRRD
jgi:hypothetical protein